MTQSVRSKQKSYSLLHLQAIEQPQFFSHTAMCCPLLIKLLLTDIKPKGQCKAKKKLNEEKEIPWKMGFLNSKLNQNLKFLAWIHTIE